MNINVSTDRIKRGTIREDGMRFWRYIRGEELWVTEESFHAQREKDRLAQSGFRKREPERYRKNVALWQLKNAESIKRKRADYNHVNKERISANQTAKRKSCPVRAFEHRVRNRLSPHKLRFGWATDKSSKSLNMLGCDHSILKSHFESLLKKNVVG